MYIQEKYEKLGEQKNKIFIKKIAFAFSLVMIYFDLVSVTIVSASILFIFILTSVVPIIRLSNKRPMIIIREE